VGDHFKWDLVVDVMTDLSSLTNDDKMRIAQASQLFVQAADSIQEGDLMRCIESGLSAMLLVMPTRNMRQPSWMNGESFVYSDALNEFGCIFLQKQAD
jgi:hypothetical protein